MPQLDKSALLAALQPATTTITVDGFGPLVVRQLTVAQTDIARARAQAGKGDAPAAPSEFGLYLLLVAVTDTAGNPVFDDPDLPALRAASGAKIDQLVAKVLELNGFSAAKGTDPGN